MADQLTRSNSFGKKTSAPGPAIHQLAGTLPTLWRDPLTWLMDGMDRYGDIVRYQIRPFLTAHLITRPEHVEHVLQTHYQNYPKYVMHKLFFEGFGEGLVTSSGELWKRQRRLIQPLFNHDWLVQVSSSITALADQMRLRWERDYGQETEFDVAAEMMSLARKIIVEALLGADITTEVVEARQAFLNAAPLALVFGDLPIPPRRRLQRAQAVLDRRLWQIITEHRQAPTQSDLLSLMLDARDKKTGQGMSDQQIHDELLTLIFTGHDTVAQAMTWAWYLLWQHPEVAERLRSELAEHLSGRLPTFADLPTLTYTAQVCKEVLRIFPPAWAGGRYVLRDDEIGGYAIPAGSYVIFSSYATHHHPDVWQNSNRFDPERFDPTREGIQHPFAYFPFGAGPRICIGRDLAMLEMQLIVATVAQHCHLGRKFTLPVELDSRVVVLRPRHGLMMHREAVP
jgi:cytochrome P450